MINTSDTLQTCWQKQTEPRQLAALLNHTNYYLAGNGKPHYPVPATRNQWALAHPVVLYMDANDLLARE